jgi:hypothetical protein
MAYGDKRVRKAEMRLSDGRQLMYFGEVPERPDDIPTGGSSPGCRCSRRPAGISCWASG